MVQSNSNLPEDRVVFDEKVVTMMRFAEKNSTPNAQDALDQLPFKPATGSTTKFLDLACGTAVVSRLARKMVSAEQLKDIQFTLLDNSEPMLEATRKIMSNEHWENGKTVNADMMDMPEVESDQFDYIVSNFGYGYCLYPDKAFKESFRVLKSGGQLAFTFWKTIGWYPQYQEALTRIRTNAQTRIRSGIATEADEKLQDLPGLPDESAVLNSMNAAGEWDTPEYVQKCLKDIGFVDYQVNLKPCELTISLADTVTANSFMVPNYLLKMIYSEEQTTSFKDVDLTAYIDNWFNEKYAGQDEVTTHWTAWVYTVRKP